MWINSKFALRVDDMGMHAVCCGMNMWTAKMGAPTVNINGKKAYRKDDMGQSCGGMTKLIEGSADVIIGDGASGGSAKSTGASAPAIPRGAATTGQAARGATSGGGGSASSSSSSSSSSPAASRPAPAPAPAAPPPPPPRAARPSATPAPPAEEAPAEELAWIEIEVLNADGTPAVGTPYKIELPDGKILQGRVDPRGMIRREKVPEGTCKVWLPDVESVS